MIVCLDNIRSAHNVGSIFRTADAAGCAKIYLVGLTPAPVDKYARENKKVTKVSLGAERSVSWEQVESMSLLPTDLKRAGYKVLALEQAQNSISLFDFHPRRKAKYALILGNEIGGLDNRILKQVDTVLEIPMAGQKESLNVAVAFGIAVFQLLR